MSKQALIEKVRHQRGQDMIELALVLPVLLVLTLGVLDLGRGLGVYIAMKNASREGARYVSLYSNQATEANAKARVVAEAAASGFAGLDPADVTVAPAFGWMDGQAVTVAVDYDFPLLTTLIIGTRTIRLHASTQMVVIGGS